jgi:hypothetical protein
MIVINVSTYCENSVLVEVLSACQTLVLEWQNYGHTESPLAWSCSRTWIQDSLSRLCR